MPTIKPKIFSWLVISIVVAIVLRVILAFWLGDHADPISGASDQYSYDMLAQQILAGKGFSFPTNWYPFTPANEPTAHWSYLYTLYLAGVYAVFGHHPLVARLIQVLLSGLNLWFVFKIGARIWGDWVGLVAAMLTAIYGYLVFFNATLMTQTFYILAVLGAIYLAIGLGENPTRRSWVLLGIIIGIGALVRQTLLLFAPVLFAWIILTRRWQVQWRDIILSIVAIGFFVLPWTIYNYFTFNDFLLLNSNGGYWFYSSNHPMQGIDFDQNLAVPLPDKFQGMSEPALDRALFREGLNFIVADPVRFFLLSLNRVKDYFWIAPSDQSSVISNVARTFSFALYLPFMVYGLVLSRRAWRACIPLYLYVAFDTMLCLTSWAAPRYRLPSDAIMIVFAGLAVMSLATRFKLVPQSDFSNGAIRSSQIGID